MIRLVLIEDVEEERQGLRYLLSLDPQLEVLKTYARAEPFLESFPLLTVPDIVLMDIWLDGEMTGIEATKLIKANLDIPVIYITAYTDETTLEKARESDPQGFIQKPIEESELFEIFESVLKQ